MQRLNIKYQNYNLPINNWMKNVIKEDGISHYKKDGNDFINDEKITKLIGNNRNPEKKKVRDIIEKSLCIERLEPEEVATLLNVENKDLWKELFQAAGEIKKRVYDNRIVTFAPLYLSNFCVNSCLYCAFRKENSKEVRKRLTMDEVKRETEALVSLGHKRLIVVYGEHPLSDVDYIADSIRTIYETKVGNGEIRRVNINTAPLCIEKLKILKEANIGTYQVFQETYHHRTYKKVHPAGSIKSDYRWRLYALHRAQEAGIDDVAIGVLFGLYDWKFEVMGLLYHARNLEKLFGVGPHTISFPRLEPAVNTPFLQQTKYKVSDEDFKKLVAVIRLAVPYAGMILTARENPKIRREVIPLGITQIDASTRIGIGAYSDRYTEQEAKRQQFLLGDTRSLDEVIRELALNGYITSFCTAGYRCGRTGKCIMDLLKTGKERWFCKLNAVLTFREWLNDFASKKTKKEGEKIIKKEVNEIREKLPKTYPRFTEYYKRIKHGERDLYF